MSNPHTDAVKALLSPLPVHVTRAPPGATGGYVVLHPDQGSATTTTLSQSVSTWRGFTFQTTCVANVPEGAQDLAAAVDGKLLDQTPTVTGRKCNPIRKSVSRPVERDDDLPTPLYMAQDVWRFSSTPA